MISVIVCTYNRDIYLPKTLAHLARQSAEKSLYEVLIIDNNSKDDTPQIAKDFISKHSAISVSYFLELNQGHTYARNRGIKEAKGQILTFIDDDAFVDTDFIKNIHHYFNFNKEVKAIGGKIIPVYETESPKWMSKFFLPLVSALDMGSHPKRFSGSKFPIGANMSFRKEVFEKYGLFDVNLGRRGTGLEGGDEKEVFLRLKKNNEEIHYVPNVVVDHIIPAKRTTMDYVKGLAMGVGSSERKRLSDKPFSEKLGKIVNECAKIVGSLILFIAYALRFRFQAAFLLLRFRYWVLMGMVLKNKPF
jgi:glycosyltransferase involved in cell wall biosynthesis